MIELKIECIGLLPFIPALNLESNPTVVTVYIIVIIAIAKALTFLSPHTLSFSYLNKSGTTTQSVPTLIAAEMKSWIAIPITFLLFVLVLSEDPLPPVTEANADAAEVSSTTGSDVGGIGSETDSTAAGNISTAGPVIWNENAHTSNNLTVGSECNITMGEKMNSKNISVIIITDNCTDEQARKFMHCNPTKNKCECYRDWGFEAPNYTDPSFSEIPEWFVYEEEAGECVVRHGMKCGSVTGNAPYLCEGEGRCIKTNKKDAFLLYCEGAAQPIPRLSTAIIVIVTSYFIYRDFRICI